MKYILSVLFLIAVAFSADGQNVSESNISLGLSKTSSSVFEQHYDEAPPSFLIINGSKSWYSQDSWISFRKEAGANLQLAHIDLSGGGLAAANHYSGNIISFFANASLQARMRIINYLAIGIGPEAELLIIGISKLNNEYYSIFNPPTAGNKDLSGMNRDYFNQPTYGIKLSLYESKPDANTTIGLHFSYLWTTSEPSNFYTSNYSRISLLIGFKKLKDEVPLELVN